MSKQVPKKVVYAAKQDITIQLALYLLRTHIANLPPPEPTEFKVGDAVLVDNVWVGVVDKIDIEGTVSVYYLNDEGQIVGPDTGYSLTKIDETKL